MFPGRSGTVLGTPLRLRDGEAGDWYLDETIVASPISGLLAGLAVDDVPPLTLLFEAEGPWTWAPSARGGTVRVGDAGSHRRHARR